MSILDVTDKPIVDESIISYEYHAYDPESGTNLNNTGEIRINITLQDLFTHPSESYLLIEGSLVKTDGTAFAAGNLVTLTNNGIMHLFSRITYSLSDKEVESLYYPGRATTMFGLLKYSNQFAKAQGLNQLWIKDTATTAVLADNLGFAARQSYIIDRPDPRGTFSFAIPLKHIFGFCDDYDKIVYGFKHTLNLVRQSDDDAIFRADTAGLAGKVTLTKISWMMPHVMPADAEKLTLYKTIESKVNLACAFRSRQCESISVDQTRNFSWTLSSKTSPELPRYIIVGFQTGKSGSQTTNPSIFDHVNVTMIRAKLNSDQYPAVDYSLSFTANQISRAYRDASLFSINYYGCDELITGSNITPSDYKDLHPLFVFDVSKQNERLKSSSVNIKIEATFSANVAANTIAYALIICDTMLTFQSDGQKLNIIS